MRPPSLRFSSGNVPGVGFYVGDSPFSTPTHNDTVFPSSDLTTLALLQIFPTAWEDEYILGKFGFVSIV